MKSNTLEAEAALQSSFDTELQGHKIRRGAKWLEEVEALSAFFLNLEYQKHRKHFTSSVWNLDGRGVFSLPDLMSAHEEFYSTLFAEEPIEVEVQNLLLSYVSRTLSENDGLICKVFLLLEELTQALQLANRNNTLGPDGP